MNSNLDPQDSLSDLIKIQSNEGASQPSAQDRAIANLESQGYRFSNWIPFHPDANGQGMDDQQTAVMIKRGASRWGRDYREVEPNGTIN